MDNITAHQEDLFTLRNMLGMSEELAEDILAKTILITIDSLDSIAVTTLIFLKAVLSRTVSHVADEFIEHPDIEITINHSSPKTDAQKIFVLIADNKIEISKNPIIYKHNTLKLHNSLLLLAATYVSAFTLRHIIGHNSKLPIPQDKMVIDFSSLFSDMTFFDREIDVEKMYLAGSGAIGNAFLYALKEFKIKGELVITDPDYISDGNLNRCIWFDKSMIGKNKAETIASLAQPYFPNLKLYAHPGFLNTVPERNSDDKWLKRLVVGVDSRRARRGLQSEIPGEVFDASTTNIEETVFHFHKRPLDGNACLECIYHEDAIENAHEKHIAESLGISLLAVKDLNINHETALKIIKKYPKLTEDRLIGLSYDTLFKELCGKGKLHVEGEQQIYAPFGFVSVLAGTILAIETVRRIKTNANDYNYWKLSPWTEPVPRLKQYWKKNNNCSFCNSIKKSEFADILWSEINHSKK